MLEQYQNQKDGLRIAVIGASGGIGRAMVQQLEGMAHVATVHALSRSPTGFASPKIRAGHLDYTKEETIEAAAKAVGEVDLVLVTTGILHGEMADGTEFGPEKSWKALDADTASHVITVNTIGPSLVMKHFLPLLPRSGKSAFAALVARVGSISDNEIGGWYAYRASKAALMMMIKTASVELARKRKEALCVGLHPGTVDTGLSAPFRNNPHDRFSPAQSAEYLLGVLDGLNASDTGRQFDWQGKEVPA